MFTFLCQCHAFSCILFCIFVVVSSVFDVGRWDCQWVRLHHDHSFRLPSFLGVLKQKSLLLRPDALPDVNPVHVTHWILSFICPMWLWFLLLRYVKNCTCYAACSVHNICFQSSSVGKVSGVIHNKKTQLEPGASVDSKYLPSVHQWVGGQVDVLRWLCDVHIYVHMYVNKINWKWLNWVIEFKFLAIGPMRAPGL